MLVIKLFFLHFDDIQFDCVSFILNQNLRAFLDLLIALLIVSDGLLLAEGVQPLHFKVLLVLHITEIIG